MTIFNKLQARAIAVLDADPWIRDSISFLLQGAVSRLRTFDNVGDGLRAVETERFDVIICDYGMSGMDGIAFLIEAGRRQPDAYLILIAGYPVRQIADIAAREGIHECLQKPFTIEDFEKTLRGFFDRARPEAEQPESGTAE